VSCRIISADEFDSIIPVNPAILNKKMIPIDHIKIGVKFILEPW